MAEILKAKVRALLISRRFWATVGVVLFNAIGERFGLSQDQVLNITIAIGTWIVGDSLKNTEVAS